MGLATLPTQKSEAPIIFDHPYGPQASENESHNRSFTAAVYKKVKDTIIDRGEGFDLIDLLGDNFNPVMTKEDLVSWRTKIFVDMQSDDYFRRILESDRVIFIFPIWWESMPASTKGFIDKVFSKGRLKSGDLKKRPLVGSCG